MNEQFFIELKEKIQPYFEAGGSHDFSHTQRVYNLAVKIAEQENADLDVIKAAALLHDVARLKEDNNEINCHAEEGARIAKEILSKTKFPKEKIEPVCNAIRVHRFSKGLKPETKEAEILQDADRLDAIGAITIARVFATGGKRGRQMYNPKIPPYETYGNNPDTTSINHFHEKILKLKPETFKTQTAKEIAGKRYQFVENFIEQFKKEWDGKDEITNTINPKREFLSTVFVIKNNQVLLTFNKKVKKFVPLGGHIEENELPCESAIREAKEESGYDVELLDFSDLKHKNLTQNLDIHLDIVKPDHHHINISYIGKIIGGNELSESDENTELRWFSEQDLLNSDEIFENTRELALKAIKLSKNIK